MPSHSHARIRAVGLALVRATVAVTCFLPLARADVTSEQVQRAIRRGVRVLRAMQKEDGSWPERHYPGGESCLATLALLHAGESPDSDAVAPALERIHTLPNRHVYVVALKIMVLAQADPEEYETEIRAAAQWLIKAQDQSGLWSYVPSQRRFDHSNSQFALLGLHAAAQAGVKIPAGVWNKALAAVTRTQNKDGGWAYQHGGGSYGSMTAAGVADLIILTGRVQKIGRQHPIHNGRAPNCGKYKTNQPLADGLKWLARHFRADRNPRRNSHTFYWLYAVERCGMLSGQRYFGRHDWYREGARRLVRTQRGNGTWDNRLVDTSFALLFLAKGHKPLVMQKLQWSDDDAWNPVRYAADNLIAFIDEQLGQPVAWQTVRFDDPLEQWLAAPLLLVHGYSFPKWNDRQRAKLRAYIEQGGTLLAEACCGRKEFREGFRAFAAKTFPEVPLRELGQEHSIYHVHYDCQPYGLMGLDLGCRTSVIFSPNDLSCLWERADVPRLSEEAFELGTNVAAYAMGRRPLIDRLDVVVLPETQPADPGPPPRDALRFGQVVYESDWRPFPLALVRLAEYLRRQVNLDVVSQYRQVRLTDPDLYACPLLYMAGHYDFEFSEKERAGLASHLRRGGFLLVDNCCGPEPFDTAFRAMLRQAFPDAVLEPLPADHPIFRGQPGFDVTTVRYGPDVRRQHPELAEPELWGLDLDDRLALVYSPYALGCGLDGQEFEGCWGLAAEDARRLAANIVLYALTH